MRSRSRARRVGDAARPTEAQLLEAAREGHFPIEIPFSRRRERAPYFGATYGQDIEPAGEYMIVVEERLWSTSIPGQDLGYVTFRRPLVLPHVATDASGWKGELVARFGGKTKRALSAAIKRAGYDGVLTFDAYGFSEIVNLGGRRRLVRRT